VAIALGCGVVYIRLALGFCIIVLAFSFIIFYLGAQWMDVPVIFVMIPRAFVFVFAFYSDY
jgi:hypothetical protein